MDGWTAGRRSRIFCQGGGGGGGVQARPPEYRIRTWDQYIRTYVYIHTHLQIGTWMFLHMQTDGHTCTCIDGKPEDRLFITCIIIHVRACRGIILKFPMKMKDLVPSKPTYFIFIGYLKTRGMEGFRANPINPNWIRHCLYMYANAQTFWLHHTWACNSYVLQKIYVPSCLMNLGRVVL